MLAYLATGPGVLAGPPPACDYEALAQFEAGFKHLVQIQARDPKAVSEAAYKLAALNYITAAEGCLQASEGENATGYTFIDAGGLYPPDFPEEAVPKYVFPAFLSGGQSSKWGAGSPFPGGRDLPGPGLAGGTITYSYMAQGVSLGNYQSGGGSPSNVAITNLANYDPCFKAEIDAAFAAWSAVANIQFVEVADNSLAYGAAGARGNIRIGAHHIDGPGNTNAHAYYPPFDGSTAESFNSIPGDVHFDISETDWGCDSGIRIGLIALHEIGHSIGLGHEPFQGQGGRLAIMNAFINFNLIQNLQPDDINGAVAIYGTVPATPCLPVFSDTHEDGFAGWTVAGVGSSTWWGQTDGTPQNNFGYGGSANYWWFTNEAQAVSDAYLESPLLTAPNKSLRLQFFHYFDNAAESDGSIGYDGGVVEIKGETGDWVALEPDHFTKNGYNQLISSDYNSPIAGRPAFSGNSQGYIESVVNLAGLVSPGETFQVRFRAATSEGGGTNSNINGWLLDDVNLCSQVEIYLPQLLKNF